MKNLLKILLPLVLVLNFSCKEDLDEINIDPDTFPSANAEQVLSSAIGFLGYVVDTDLNFESFLWAQYYTWGIGVSIGNAERYVAEPDDHDSYWRRAYANILADLDFMSGGGSNVYGGVSKILEAYVYQGLVDHFGNVPYTEAVKGSIEDGSNLQPGYDDAADIYADLLIKIDEGIALIELAQQLEELDEIGDNDFIFQGDATKWIKFANSLKLRILMRTSEVDPKGAEITSLISSGTFIETVDDMPFVPFSGTAGDLNPMYARAEWGVGMFYFASNATLNVLEGLNDDRRFDFYTLASTGDEEGLLNGIDQGTIDDEPFTAPDTNYSLSSSEYSYGDANSVILMSPWEVWFLRAEAAARYGTADSEVTAFETAVELNFDYIGTANSATYISSLGYSAASALDDKLDMIGTQKWISLNGTQEDEGWIEARRFDRPDSRLFTEGIWQTPPLSVLNAGEFPASWLYPADEQSLNSSAPAQRKLTDKIFWDN